MLSPEELARLNHEEYMAFVDGARVAIEIIGSYRDIEYQQRILDDPQTPNLWAINPDPRLRKLESMGVQYGIAKLRGGAEVSPSGYAQPVLSS